MLVVGPSLTGSLDFSKGTGSFFRRVTHRLQLHAPSQLVLGIEDDVSFLNSNRGRRIISSTYS